MPQLPTPEGADCWFCEDESAETVIRVGSIDDDYHYACLACQLEYVFGSHEEDNSDRR